MHNSTYSEELEKQVFEVTTAGFEALALAVFQFQYAHNTVYRQYVQALSIHPSDIHQVEKIPFLPIRLFKSHDIVTTHFQPEAVFESSGTTTTINSRHFVRSLALYEQSFMQAFSLSYGDVKDWCIIGLLPSYLERTGSSLVVMVDALIRQSGHAQSGFYLHDFEGLHHTLSALEKAGTKTLLIGVTFALLDFAVAYPQLLQHTVIMETGGMKGRRKEMIRQEVHEVLQQAFGVKVIHSEYGMTELLSQGYSFGKGIFNTPPWMKIGVRDDEDPLTVTMVAAESKRGVINVIDLANLYSCSFIATDDVGVLHADNSFEILGRLDNSDLRGCSLMAI